MYFQLIVWLVQTGVEASGAFLPGCTCGDPPARDEHVCRV